MIGHTEFGLPLNGIKVQFVDSGLITLEDWFRLTANPSDPPEFPIGHLSQHSEPIAASSNVAEPAPTRAPADVADQVQLRNGVPSRLPVHYAGHSGQRRRLFDELVQQLPGRYALLVKLKELASRCHSVVEVGPGLTTAALLEAQPKRLTSFGSRGHNAIAEELAQSHGDTELDFVVDEEPAVIGSCDLLVIDVRHSAAALLPGLERHHERVSRWIVIPDTYLFGTLGEDATPGLMLGLLLFLRKHREWTVVSHDQNGDGFTLLSKDPADKPRLPGAFTMAANFAQALAKHVADGMEKVPKPVYETRLEVCTLCGQRTGDRCAVCGCGLSEKASWRTPDCPLGKWFAVEGTSPALTQSHEPMEAVLA